MRKRGCVSSHDRSTFPSPPGLPGSWENSAMSEKGWYSERVTQASGSSRRNISVTGLTPFYSGRTLPSKWEDAERWISSPIVGNVAGESLQSLPRRRGKSNSGPIVEPPGAVTYNQSYSPAVARNFMVRSALSTGILRADAVSLCCEGGGDGYGGQSYIPSVPVSNAEQVQSQLRWSDILSESSSPGSRDDNHGDKKEMDAVCVSQQDMAMKMGHSHDDGTESSPKGKSSFSSSSSPALLSVMKTHSDHVSKLEVRDVRVDKGTPVIWWSKGHKVVKSTNKAPPDLVTLNHNSIDVGASSLDMAEAAINVSKLQTEEARIMAWENLQKAKAEAAINKLEVKLERKRSSSIDNILYKLKKAQMKANKMRSSLSFSQTNQVPKTQFELLSFRKHFQSSSLRRFFNCYRS